MEITTVAVWPPWVMGMLLLLGAGYILFIRYYNTKVVTKDEWKAVPLRDECDVSSPQCPAPRE